MQMPLTLLFLCLLGSLTSCKSDLNVTQGVQDHLSFVTKAKEEDYSSWCPSQRGDFPAVPGLTPQKHQALTGRTCVVGLFVPRLGNASQKGAVETPPIPAPASPGRGSTCWRFCLSEYLQLWSIPSAGALLVGEAHCTWSVRRVPHAFMCDSGKLETNKIPNKKCMLNTACNKCIKAMCMKSLSMMQTYLGYNIQQDTCTV